jgi:hypothetical protein
LTRLRLGALLALAVAIGVFSHAPQAMAAAEVHRLNLVISAMPSQVDGSGMNELLDRYNTYPLNGDNRTLNPIEKLKMGWYFDGELRYFVRPNFALAVGASTVKCQSKEEFLPAIGQSIDVTAEVTSVPIHVGAQYYLAPYNQGDFQARAFVGGGLMSLTSTKASFVTVEHNLPYKEAQYPDRLDTLDVSSLGGSSRLEAAGDSPGFYLEVGAHMFFAARYSVIVGGMYRSLVIRDLDPYNEGVIYVPVPGRPGSEAPLQTTPDKIPNLPPYRISKLDMSGFGVRMAIAIGF